MRKIVPILLIVGVILIIFAIFVGKDTTKVDITPYKMDILHLEDSIKELRSNIYHYQSKLDSLQEEREKIHVQIKEILKENEEIDRILVNGDWDANIRFLTEFLSKEDTLGE
mgnify:CR=1 FL=1